MFRSDSALTLLIALELSAAGRWKVFARPNELQHGLQDALTAYNLHKLQEIREGGSV